MTDSPVEWLREAGLGPDEAARKAALFARAEAALGADSRAPAVRWLWVPGRIEVLGKHTDYAGGRSVLCAAERGLCVAWRPRLDAMVHLRDATRHDGVATELAATARAARSRVGTVSADGGATPRPRLPPGAARD